MSTYVFPTRSEHLVIYIFRLFKLYGAFSIAIGCAAGFLVLGIVHPVFTVLALVCLALGLVVGQDWQRDKVRKMGLDARGKETEIEYLRRRYDDLAQMYAARERMNQGLADENLQIKEELESLRFKKRSA